jgi:hypothetical protein
VDEPTTPADVALPGDPDLDDVMAPDRPERFRIADDAAAEWAAGKVRKALADLDAVDALYARELERLNEWRDHARNRPARTVDHLTALLVDYGLEQRDAGRKTVALPSGTVTTRAGQPGVAYTDEAAFLAWAEANAPDLVVVKKSPDRAGAKKVLAIDPDAGQMFAPDGTAVPGVDVTPATVTATFTPAP